MKCHTMRIGFLLHGGSISWYPHLAAVEWLATSVATFSAQFVLWGDESWMRVHLRSNDKRYCREGRRDESSSSDDTFDEHDCLHRRPH